MHNFTHNDFIRHYYDEHSDEETIAMKALLKDDAELQKLYEEVILSFSVLIEIKPGVSDQTIGKLIQYANAIPSKIHLN